MLKQVTAVRFIKRMGSGRTFPCLLECEDDHGCSYELVVKYSANLYDRERNLAFEALAAMLAADLGLPLPEPFIVYLEPEFISVVSDAEVKAAMQRSSPFAFGSTFVHGYTAWPHSQKIPKSMTSVAAEIYVFDQIIANSDRRPERPNCLFSGDQPLIFDHELTFMMDRILFWKQPWVEGGFDNSVARENHIFAGPYYEEPPQNLDRFVAAWESLDTNRFVQYVEALPQAWLYDQNHLSQLKSYLDAVKQNIRVVAQNALKVLR